MKHVLWDLKTTIRICGAYRRSFTVEVGFQVQEAERWYCGWIERCQKGWPEDVEEKET